MGDTNGTVEMGGDAGRLPQLRVSAMQYLTQGFNFIVSLNEFTYGFQSVSGLTIRKNTAHFQEGGVNDHVIVVGEPADDLPTLTFKRGLMMKSPSVITNAAKAAAARIPNNLLRKVAMIGVNALDPQESLESGPAIGLIQVYSRERKLRALYSFLSLGMTEWSSEDLDANDSKVLIESITVVHTGITRLPVTWPSIVGAISNLASDVEVAKVAVSSQQKAEESKERMQAAEELKKKKQEEIDLWRKQKEEENALKEEEKKKKELEEELRKEEEKKATEERIKQAEQRRKESEERRKAAEEAKKPQEGPSDENEESENNESDESNEENTNEQGNESPEGEGEPEGNNQ